MSTPHQSDDDSHIADTGMFKRFVEHEEQMDDGTGGRSTGRWVAIGAIVVIVVIAVVIWLLTR